MPNKLNCAIFQAICSFYIQNICISPFHLSLSSLSSEKRNSSSVKGPDKMLDLLQIWRGYVGRAVELSFKHLVRTFVVNYSHIFLCKNFVKSTYLSLKAVFSRNIFQVWVNFSFFHTVEGRREKWCKMPSSHCGKMKNLLSQKFLLDKSTLW